MREKDKGREEQTESLWELIGIQPNRMRNNSFCSNEDEKDEMIKMSKISQIKETNEIRDDMLIYELNNGMCCCGNEFHYKDKLPVYFSFTEKSLIGCFHPTFSIKECKKIFEK